jgi:very-short-patch-repair endonuclease
MSESWDNLTEDEREYRRQLGRDYWNSLPDEEKQRRISVGADAIRLAAKEGSKLEKFLYDTLTNEGFILEFHRERVVTNQRLQVDIFLPELSTAIEVDGPSHFLPIWGEETLQRNRRADNQKSGLILAQGWCLIRVRQDKPLSQKYKRDLSVRILSELEQIKKKFPAKGKRMIIIGGEEYDA